MRAVILSIGSELMQGFLTDTNATFITQELNAIGVEPVGVFQVGDDLERIITAFRRAVEDAEIVIASGGIGPTEDDLTREAIAALCGEEVYVDHSIVDQIRSFFHARGLPMPEQNVKQAWLIPSAESLPNPMGTAPGWFVRLDGRVIACMPGVPREMRRMLTEQVIPRILPLLSGSVIVTRTLKTIGIGESAAEQAILDIIHDRHPVVATYAKNDGVHIRITAVAGDPAAATAEVVAAERRVRERLGAYVYGYLDDSLAAAILAPLRAIERRIGVWEVGTAGRLAGLLQDDPQAMQSVADARSTGFELASTLVGSDDPLAIAVACAREAATWGNGGFGASIAVRIDPGENADRDQGRVGIALAHPGGVFHREHVVSANAPEIRRRAVLWSADFFWNAIKDAVHLIEARSAAT